MMKKRIIGMFMALMCFSGSVSAAGGGIAIGDTNKEILFTGSATEHNLLLSSSGVVTAWGNNTSGQCGAEVCDESTYNYIDFDTDSKIVQVAAGNNFSLALDESGTVWGWGSNDQYQLGITRPTDTPDYPTYFITPQKCSGNAAYIAAGDNFSVVLHEDGRVFLSGNNQAHQLIRFPDVLGHQPEIVKIAAKANNILALDADQVIYNWHAGEDDPKVVAHVEDGRVVDLAASKESGVYITEEEGSYKVYTFGTNLHYQLGMADRDIVAETPECVLTIPDAEGKSVVLNTGLYSTFIDVFDTLSRTDEIEEYCFGTGCYYMSEAVDDYGIYYEGFEENVIKEPARRRVKHQVIAAGNDRNMAYRFDDAIELFGNEEPPEVKPIIEPVSANETMYEYQYENSAYQSYNVNFVKLNQEAFEAAGENYAYWEYVNEHSFHAKIKDFIGGIGNIRYNPKLSVINLGTDLTGENRIIGTMGPSVWNFDNYDTFFKAEQQEIMHGEENGSVIHVRALLNSQAMGEPMDLNIPPDVKIFYTAPGEITENTELGIYLYGLPDGTEGRIENISGNTFDIILNGNSTADLDYDLQIGICYVYASELSSQKGVVGDYDLNNALVYAADTFVDGAVIQPTENTPEKMTVAADLTKGRESGQTVAITLEGGTFNRELNVGNWSIVGSDELAVSSVERIDANHAELILSGNSADKYTDTDFWVMCTGEEYSDSRVYDAESGSYFNEPLTSDNSVTAKKQKRSSGGLLSGSALAKPTANINSGEVAAGTLIELSAASGAEIYYTTDGTAPTVESTLYTEPIVINDDVTIQYIAVSGTKKSDVQTSVYTVKKAAIKLKDNSSEIKYIEVPAGEGIGPDEAMTRYEILSALDKLFDIEDMGIQSDFTDVAPEYSDIINKFTGAKLIEGYPDNTFRGDAGITRAEFVKILCDMLKPAQDGTEYFSDVSGHWAEQYINSFYQLDLIKGYPDGTFKPDNSITRAEAITILNKVAEIEGIQPEDDFIPDVSDSHWAYETIYAAVKMK